ncbi:hypothetical protein [Haloferula sp. BvORR071]|uniref:hypothetical protein n=1 Tax=Haloferula sp. BvORR071 TaxID=1396141 RepID=UPI00224100AD|nr:hypothetical protein [Haloferula sp. BvORR071]
MASSCAAAVAPLDPHPPLMIAANDRPLIFRPAYPDEIGRALFVESQQTWPHPGTFFFLAVEDGEPARIVGVIRCMRRAAGKDHPAWIDFRLIAGPGGEIAGHEAEFLNAFLSFASPGFHGILRHLTPVAADSPLDVALGAAGFSPRYREYRLEIPYQIAADRGVEVHALMARIPSPLRAAQIIPLRDCQVEQAIPLLTASQLMSENEIRSIWESGERARLDREASACLVHAGETLGVILCADAGPDLRVMAIAGREDIPGARRRVIPLLTHHMFHATAGCGYQRVIFRANAETAVQTRNLAHRAGGSTLLELRRWVKEIH